MSVFLLVMRQNVGSEATWILYNQNKSNESNEAK